jgi:uncharacterized protein (TIGR00369 family)
MHQANLFSRSIAMAGPIIVQEGPRAGWLTWPPHEKDTYGTRMGPLYWRYISPTHALCQIDTNGQHVNGAGALHGGFLMSFADVALYAASARLLVDFTAVTLTCSCEFLSAGVPGMPLEAQLEVLKETGKTIFLRGLIQQEGQSVLNFSGTLRKIPRKNLATAALRQD